jgi:hypothetical protein
MSRKRRSKGAAGEDHVDAGGLVGPVGDCGGSDDRVGAGEAGAGAVGDVDRGADGPARRWISVTVSMR